MPIAKIAINELEGSIEYEDSSPVKFNITFPDEEIRQDIITYLSTPREYRIPESQRIDDYRIDVESPVADKMYFVLALCELKSRLGVGLIGTE